MKVNSTLICPWGTVTLGEISLMITSGSRGWGQFYSDDGETFLRMCNIPREGIRLKLNDIKHVNLNGFKEGTRAQAEIGDILISITAELGKIGLIQSKALGKMYVNQHIALVKIKHELACANFVAFYLSHDDQRKRFQVLNDSGAKAGLNLKTISKFRIKLPPLPEQKTIAAILTTWDRAIETTEQLIAAKEKRKQALMQQLLTGKVRFGAFSGQEWKRVRLGKLFKAIRRKNTVGQSLVLTASGEHGLVDQRKYFNRSVSAENLEGYYLLKQGEFAYNRSSMNGYPYGAIKRLDQHPEGVLSTLYMCFAPDSKLVFSDFYKHYFDSFALNAQLRGITQVGARAHGLLNVSVKDFMSIKLHLPPIKEQKKIAEVLDSAAKDITAEKKKLKTLQAQKKGLMQQLLTCKVRVNGIKS